MESFSFLSFFSELDILKVMYFFLFCVRQESLRLILILQYCVTR